jgi:hypothetical protein
MSSCKLQLELPLNKINEINKNLFKPYEISGVIQFNSKNEVVGVSTNKGDADSVYTPNNVINFHTHPISAYKQGETVWGWPSGEDIRESIKFGLSGNKAHIVFSVEGLYIIQVNSCILKKLKEFKKYMTTSAFIKSYFQTKNEGNTEKNMQNLEAESMYNPASPAYANQNSYLYNNNLK